MRRCETVLIAGCGELGQRVGQLLSQHGDRVLGLRRHTAALPPGIEPLAGDLAIGVPALPPLDRVVFCAAPDDGSAAAYRTLYELGFSNLLRALRAPAVSPRRVLLVTSTRCYAQRDGGWVDEDSAVSARDAQTASLLHAEALLRASGLPGVVLRAAGLYGAGEGPLLRSLREGRARVAPDSPRWGNRMHRQDAARAIVHLLGLADPAPLYLGVDCEPADHAVLLRELAERIGAPQPAVGDALSDLPNRRCSNARLLASGFSFQYPSWREGYRAVLG